MAVPLQRERPTTGPIPRLFDSSGLADAQSKQDESSMTQNLLELPISCAWCARIIHAGNPVASRQYGICVTCLGDQFGQPVESIEALGDAAANRLPFGFIRLDSEGRIIAYNTEESALSGLSREKVLGRNFFRTVAPCTCVEEFEGALQKMMASGKPERAQIEFLFKFNAHAIMVNIVMLTDPSSGYATLLIRKTGEQAA
jgi:photoactive yellow protein